MDVIISIYGVHGEHQASHTVSLPEIHHKKTNKYINNEDCNFDPGFLQWKLIPKKIAAVLIVTVTGISCVLFLAVILYVQKKRYAEKMDKHRLKKMM